MKRWRCLSCSWETTTDDDVNYAAHPCISSGIHVEMVQVGMYPENADWPRVPLPADLPEGAVSSQTLNINDGTIDTERISLREPVSSEHIRRGSVPSEYISREPYTPREEGSYPAKALDRLRDELRSAEALISALVKQHCGPVEVDQELLDEYSPGSISLRPNDEGTGWIVEVDE